MAAVAQGVGDGAFAGAVDRVIVGDQQRGDVRAVRPVRPGAAGFAAGIGVVAIRAVNEARRGHAGNQAGNIPPASGRR